MNRLINRSANKFPKGFVLKRVAAKNFSGFQTEMEKFDFSDTLNVDELKLKDPNNK